MQPILANYTASITELKKSPTQILEQAGNEAVAILNHNVLYPVHCQTYGDFRLRGGLFLCYNKPIKFQKGFLMQTITINVKDKVLDNVLYLLKNLSDIEVITENTQQNKTKQNDDSDERWEYWKDVELDNFGKIAIGLSKHNYDDEDYDTW